MRMRKWSVTVLTAALTLLLAACGSAPKAPDKPATPPAAPAAAPAPAPAPKMTKVRFSEVVHSVFYAPQYVAVAQGFFKEQGIELDETTAQGSDKGMAAIIANTADVALVGPETNIYLVNQDGGAGKVRIFTQLTAKDGTLLIGRQPNPNFKWTDLRGKTIIGWRPGSMPEMVLEYLLRQNGLEPGKDVNVITNVGPPANVGAFLSGQGDYITLLEPSPSQFEKDGKGVVLTSLGQDAGAFPYTVYLASSAYIKANPDVVQRFTNAIYKGVLWTQKSPPAEVAKAVQPFFKETDLATLTKTIERYQKLQIWNPTPVPVPEQIERLQDVMVSGGVLDKAKRVKYADIIDDSFAKKALETVK